MDIKDISKSQLLLLAVLLSFVTSIATGITTVTLMQQAPDSVTVPVNRIIKQTVEKIQQVEGKTTVQTVVVKEEDLVVDAIAKNKSAVFTITKMGFDSSGLAAEVSAGQGFAVSPDVIVADALLTLSYDIFFVKNGSGKFKADFISADPTGFSFLKIGAPADETSKLATTPPSTGDLDKMKVGQKVIVMGNSISSSIFDGKNINITVNASNAGGLVLNLDGEALGIALSGSSTSFAPIKTITDALKALNLPGAPATQ